MNEYEDRMMREVGRTREKSIVDTGVRRKIMRKGLEHAFREMVYDRLNDEFSLEDVSREADVGLSESSSLLGQPSLSNLLIPLNDGNYKKKIRTLQSALSSEAESPELLRDKLERGLTIQETAERNGLEIRDVQRRQRQDLGRIPLSHVKEARRYLQRFERFSISENVFIEVFEEPAMVHRFLSLKAKAGTEDFKNIHGRLNDRQRRLLRKSLSLVQTLGGDVLPVTRIGVLEYILWLHADEGARPIEEWEQLYNQYIEESYKAQVAEKLRTDSKKLFSLASRSESIILSAGKHLRFYDQSRLTKKRLQRLRGLLRIEPGFYGINRLYSLSPSLMDEMDCRDPMELQYILGRYIEMTNMTIVRQAEVAIGTMGKSQWLKKMIRQYSPIRLDDFQKVIEERFGIPPATVRQVIRRELPDYLSPDGMLGQSMSLLTKREAAWFSRRLTNEIYTYEELEEAFSHIEEFSSRYLNGGALEKVGFINQGGLILRARHGNAEAYFQSILAREELFTVPDNPVFSSAPFRRVVKRMEDGHDLFRFDAVTYISISRLRKAGMNKGMIRALIKEMIDVAKHSGDDYFTFSSIQKNLNSPVLELGMENLFFEGLLHTQKRIGSIRTGRGGIFYIGRDKRTLGMFLLDLLPERGGVDVDTMRENISGRFRLDFDRNVIITNVRGKGGYFSPETGRLYRDKNRFLDSIYES